MTNIIEGAKKIHENLFCRFMFKPTEFNRDWEFRIGLINLSFGKHILVLLKLVVND